METYGNTIFIMDVNGSDKVEYGFYNIRIWIHFSDTNSDTDTFQKENLLSISGKNGYKYTGRYWKLPKYEHFSPLFYQKAFWEKEKVEFFE